ncbi:hypothetical protein [Marinilabilia salmonicolor]|uniref:hypothetical protein n=1 Tax=Marinilabilia salmonicolor TaxID=989 RepID=UPI001F16C15B|nr:hypothetical protein [Marinilabilia salmonicolor]
MRSKQLILIVGLVFLGLTGSIAQSLEDYFRTAAENNPACRPNTRHLKRLFKRFLR